MSAVTGWGLLVPTDYADGLSLAQSFFGEGETLLTNGASALASADYVDATIDDMLGADYASVIPLEEVFLGALASF